MKLNRLFITRPLGREKFNSRWAINTRGLSWLVNYRQMLIVLITLYQVVHPREVVLIIHPLRMNLEKGSLDVICRRVPIVFGLVHLLWDNVQVREVVLISLWDKCEETHKYFSISFAYDCDWTHIVFLRVNSKWIPYAEVFSVLNSRPFGCPVQWTEKI